MIISNNIGTSIEVVLSGAVTTNELQCIAVWSDLPAANYPSGQNAVETNGTTPVELVPAIQDNKRRELKYVSVYNSDTVQATVTINLNVSGTLITIVQFVIESGWTIFYDNGGWHVLTAMGAEPAEGSGSFLEIANNLSDLANAATARTNLGATTVGSNIFTITNPSAIRFIRINADNTVTLLDASSFLSAIGGGSGTVTNFSAGDLSPLFTTSEATTTTTPALSFAQVTQSANTIFAGPTSGGAANPTFRAIVATDLFAPFSSEPAFSHASLNPADATTYFWGVAHSMTAATSTLASRRYKCRGAGSISTVFMAMACSAGTSENVTFLIKNVTTATSQNISTTISLATAHQNASFTLASPLSYSASDEIEVQMVSPTWVTNPTGLVSVIIPRLIHSS